MRERGILSQFDYFLFLAALLLAFLGVLGIHNAGSSALENGIFLRQLVWVGLGVGVRLEDHFDFAMAMVRSGR